MYLRKQDVNNTHNVYCIMLAIPELIHAYDLHLLMHFPDLLFFSVIYFPETPDAVVIQDVQLLLLIPKKKWQGRRNENK